MVYATVLLAATWVGASGVRVESRDVDGDGRAEVVMANAVLTLAVAPHQGAQVVRFTTRDGFEWTSCAKRGKGRPGAFGLLVDMDTKLTWPGALARAAYSHRVLSNGPDEAAVAFRCVSTGKTPRGTNPDLVGLVYHKTLRLRRGRGDVQVDVRIENPSDRTRQVNYWQQSILSPAGPDGVNVCVRPATTGLSLAGGPFGNQRQWVHVPAGGWTSVMSADGKRAMVYLVDYHELRTLYNCVSSLTTVEYMYGPVALPPGKSWGTTVRVVPVVGLGRPIHVASPVACGLGVDVAGSRATAVFRVAATGAAFRGVRVQAKLVDRTDGTRSSALPVGTWPGDVTWHAATVRCPLPALDPSHDYGIHVTLGGGWPGGGTTAVSLPLTVRRGPDGTLRFDVGVGPSFNRGAPRRVRKLIKPDDMPGLRRQRRDGRLDVLVLSDLAQGARTNRWPKRYDLALARRWHVDEGAALVGRHRVDRATYRRSGWKCELSGLPADYPALFTYDVVVLECQDNVAIGPTSQIMLADYVRAGGGVVFLAGYDSFGKGRFAGSSLTDVLPVTIDGPWDLVPCTPGRFTLAPGAPVGDVTWAVPPRVPWVQKVKPRSGTRVVATVDGQPAIVLGSAGHGRTVAVAAAPLAGDGTLKPLLHDCPEFPKLMSRLLAWAAGGRP